MNAGGAPLHAVNNVLHRCRACAAGLSSPVQPAAAPVGPANFSYHEGQGWKMGFDEAAESQDTYSAVIGSDTWSIGLTRKEFTDFIQVHIYLALATKVLGLGN